MCVNIHNATLPWLFFDKAAPGVERMIKSETLGSEEHYCSVKVKGLDFTTGDISSSRLTLF